MRDADPAVRVMRFLPVLLRQGKVYLDVPGEDSAHLEPEDCGWEWNPTHTGAPRAAWLRKPGASLVGWVESSNGRLWANFHPEALYAELHKFAVAQGRTLPGSSALWANLQARFHPLGLMRCSKEGGVLRTTYRASSKTDGSLSRPHVISLAFPLDPALYDPADTRERRPDQEEQPRFETLPD